MSRKIGTVDLKGKEYALVPTRLKQFREDCPNGLIETSPQIKDDGTVIFTARILKDKAKRESGEATGHSFGKANGDKAFEKLETIAIGRALAILGYLASGEIASAEEMEDFYAYQEAKISDAVESLESASTIDELRAVFMSLGSLMGDTAVIEAKNKRKAELSKQKEPVKA